MKPLWNSPSFGTLRAGPTQAVVFLMVVFMPFVIVGLVILSPLFVFYDSIRRKRPAVVWRGLGLLSLAGSFLLVFPISPLYVPSEFPFRILPPQREWGFLDMLGLYVVPWINRAIVFELPLLPILIASAVHTSFFQSSLPGASRGTAS